MTKYEPRVAIETPTLVRGYVRAWVDRNLDGDLATETELQLRHDEAGEWFAEFDAPCTTAAGFAYRIGVLAERGAVWSLSIRKHGEAQNELLADSDVLTGRKHWLIGTC